MIVASDRDRVLNTGTAPVRVLEARISPPRPSCMITPSPAETDRRPSTRRTRYGFRLGRRHQTSSLQFPRSHCSMINSDRVDAEELTHWSMNTIRSTLRGASCSLDEGDDRLAIFTGSLRACGKRGEGLKTHSDRNHQGCPEPRPHASVEDDPSPSAVRCTIAGPRHLSLPSPREPYSNIQDKQDSRTWFPGEKAGRRTVASALLRHCLEQLRKRCRRSRGPQRGPSVVRLDRVPRSSSRSSRSRGSQPGATRSCDSY